MTGPARFVCSDPDAGDFEFADVDAVLDALEAALVQPTTPMFDAARQTWQAVGLHPEIRSAWEGRLRYRPPSDGGLALPVLPTVTALVRSLPEPSVYRDGAGPAIDRVEDGPGAEPGGRFAAVGLTWALVLLLVVGWVVVTFAARLADLAAGAVGLRR